MNAVIPLLDNLRDSLGLFSVLSKQNNMKLFLASAQGVKLSASTLTNLKLTRKKYYKSLKQLKGADLIEKSKGFYIPTTFGKIVYQRNVIELQQYRKYIEEMDAIDTIKSTLTPPLEDKFARIFEKWYPNKSVNRRICSLPFGIIIIDKTEVGIELVNSKQPDKFNMGIMIRDKEASAIMEQYYEGMWRNAFSDITKLKDNLFSPN